MKYCNLAIISALLSAVSGSSDNLFELQETTLAGPKPNGWVTTFNVTNHANLAIDLAWMYEFDETQERFNLYQKGFHNLHLEADHVHQNGDILTLKKLGIRSNRHNVKEPIINYNINTFNAIGQLDAENEGQFDGNFVHNYADTLITDLFDIEGDSDPVKGIEKEGVLILGAWMEIYRALYTSVQSCTIDVEEQSIHKNFIKINLDEAAALWIGRLQNYGDNTRGTMLYNLAERVAIHFNQDHGEARVNTEFLKKLNEMKAVIDADKCTGGTGATNVGYFQLYEIFQDIVGIMNTPLIQNLIHYIATNADHKVIELYLLALMPQLRSCNVDYFDILIQDIGLLSANQYRNDDLVGFLEQIQNMYSCLGVTCSQIGTHALGIKCDDEDMDKSLMNYAGYIPESDVRNIAKIDRDVSQLSILLLEGNDHSAKEIYYLGKNVMGDDNKYFALKDFAMHKDIDYTNNDEKRIYNMYEEFYDDNQIYAHALTEMAFLSPEDATYSVPTLMKTIVLPHYAMRSFFAAVDVCQEDQNLAEEFWDKGVAVLVGSIDAANVKESETGSENGMSWYGLSKQYCGYFRCDENDSSTPTAHDLMMEYIELGRQAIEKNDCAGLKKKLRSMESISVTPILQGLLYHTAQRQLLGGDNTESFASAWAFGKATLPLIQVRQKNDVNVIGDSLEEKGEFNAETVWHVIALSFADFGVECQRMGVDIFGILGEGKTFCELASSVTEFPTAAPVPGQSRAPTRSPTIAPTTEDKGDEVSPQILNGYQVTNPAAFLKKAKIALDLRDFLNLRGHHDIEHNKALDIYEKVVHSDKSLKQLSENMKVDMVEDQFFNFYRNVFRNDPLFSMVGDTSGTYADVYAHKIIRDALVAGAGVDLAYETMISMTIWMQVVHHLYESVSQCLTNESNAALNAGIAVDTAVAYYVGVTQSKGESDGFLLYNFAQKAGSLFGTIDEDTGEALANKNIMELFKDLKEAAIQCDAGPDEAAEVRGLVGQIMKYMNIPLAQTFYHQLEVGARTDKGSFYAILYGLATLPQLATCKPQEYYYLSNEITENGLDVANVDKLMVEFKKTYDCFAVTCEDIHGEGNFHCDDFVLISNTYAGFTGIRDVSTVSRMDRDLLKIKALMNEGAWGGALQLYRHGHLPHGIDTASLHELAENNQWKNNNPYFTDFKNYHDGDALYADKFIEKALEGQIEPPQLMSHRKEVILRAIQTMVLIPSGFGYLYKTVADNTCKKDEAFENWDLGAAILIGSLEGPQWGGDERMNGVSFYGLSKEFCNNFGTCSTSGDADINGRLIALLKAGQDLINGGSCGNLKFLLSQKVFPAIMIPLIQGSIENAASSTVNGDGYVFAQAVLPYVKKFDVDADEVIQPILTSFTSASNVTQTTIDVAEAFELVIADMSVNCMEVGLYNDKSDFSVCGSDTYDPLQSTELSDGLYITKTYVDDRAKIGIDVKDMKHHLERNDIAGARNVYENGWNSEIVDKNGKILGARTIASFSNNTSVLMAEEQVYNLYQYTLQKSMGTQEAAAYGHTMVEYFFTTGSNVMNEISPVLAAEAAVALNIWGWIVHELYQAWDNCATRGFTSDEDGVHSIDEAVAYWIGDEQETGSKSSGYLLYRLAEEGAEMFDLPKVNGQSKTNMNVLKLFKEAALQLTFSRACADGEVSADTLGDTIEQLVSQMTIPLIQHLIYNLRRNDRPRVKIYAHAVIPLLAPCQKDTFEYLRQKLIQASYEVSDIDEIVTKIESTFSCLGLKCRDIGKIKEYKSSPCIDRAPLKPLAGYTPSTDVREHSDLDVDIRYIDIMMQQRAYDAAFKIYKFGKHSEISTVDHKILSLRNIAVTVGRKIVPSYQLFEDYFSKGTMDVVDDLIRTQFIEPTSSASDDQRRAMVVNALKYEVLWFGALQNLYDAAAGCSENDARFEMAKQQWDVGAAMIIGSSQSTGNNDGDLLYSLAASLCTTFNTCDPRTGEAKINQKIEEALFAGSYELKFKQCGLVKEFANTIENLMKIPLIQATLDAAVQNDKEILGTQVPSLAEGYIYSRALLPYIDVANPSAATLVSKNMNFQFNAKPVVDGYKTVFKAFEDSMKGMKLDCKDVGHYLDTGEGVCEGGTSSSSSSTVVSKIMVFAITIASIAFAMI